jgi:hypothetical protein
MHTCLGQTIQAVAVSISYPEVRRVNKADIANVVLRR